jgi:hypothetical protein
MSWIYDQYDEVEPPQPVHIHVYSNGSKEKVACLDPKSPIAGTSEHKSQTPNSRESKAFALLRFESLDVLKRVYSCLKNHKSSIVNAITIRMVYDSRCLGKTKWCGVILRHIPAKSER